MQSSSRIFSLHGILFQPHIHSHSTNARNGLGGRASASLLLSHLKRARGYGTSSSEERIGKLSKGLILEVLKIARDQFLASEVEVGRKLRPFTVGGKGLAECGR